MVYGTYNYIVNGVYKPSYNSGAPPSTSPSPHGPYHLSVSRDAREWRMHITMVVIIATVPKQVATKKGIRVFSRDMDGGLGWSGFRPIPNSTYGRCGKVKSQCKKITSDKALVYLF